MAGRLRRRWRTLVAAAERSASTGARHQSSGRGLQLSWLDSPWSSGGVYGGTLATAIAPRISRDEALQVPAVLRGRNLICGSLAALPLRCIDAQRKPVALQLLEQIDPHVPNVVTLAQTFEDLLFEGISWWRIVGFAPAGRGGALFPSQARHVDVRAVSMSPPEGYPLYTLPSGAFPNGVVWVMGEPVPAENMIRFDSPLPPLLVHAARAIRRALKLEQAADRYADDPRMLDYFTPTADADPAEDNEVEELLDNWQEARRTRATGYVPAALQYHSVQQMTPADLQLAELVVKATLGLANAMGIDPEDLGVSTTSRTYQNAVDRRQDRINETYAPFLQAVADRLSMGDVTPPGQRIVWNLDGFLKADPATRWNTYRTGRQIGALAVNEIRGEEDLPALTPEQIAELQPPARAPQPTAQAAPAPVKEKPVPVRQSSAAAVTFAADPASLTFAFAAQAADVTFAVDVSARTITGLAVPYGPVARSGWAAWRFRKGCLSWADVSRVKMLRDHDTCEAIGVATAIEDTDAGLRCTFRIARGEDGDEALILAEDGVLDGLSVGIDFTELDAWQPDPTDESVRLVTNAHLREVSLCAIPAFDSARVDGVQASRTADGHPAAVFATPEGNPPMTATATTEPQAPAAPAAAPAAPAQFTAPAPDTAAFTAAVEAFTAAVGQLGAMPAEHRQIVPVGQATVREPLTYTLDGRGHSFVHDAWVARGMAGHGKPQDEAYARLRRYEDQTAEYQAVALARFANAGNTTDQAQIIPPGYRPDLYVGQIPQGRPLLDAMSSGVISNATPFKVPVWVGSSGLSGTNSENTGPSTGTITDHTYRTVTPTAQSGEFVISRELVDSSNPAIDQIALMAMREEYAQDTEGVIGAALAAATDNNTGSGQSTEGCYVSTSVGDGADLDDALMDHLAAIPFRRFLAPNRVVASSTGFPALAKAKDGMGRRLFPAISPANANGTTGYAAQTLDVNGLSCRPCYGLTAGTDDVVVFNSVDAWAWESPLLTFRFEEKSGPESIVLNIWGYFAFQVLRFTGINAIAHTGA